ncbi:MAG: class I adenylate-forming enzyme family protein, partial [Acidimicrobiales bacterium]
YGPPTLARDLVALMPDWRPKRPLKMICAGAPIPRQLVRDARASGMSLFPGYGQTEHLHSTLCGLHDPEERLYTTDGSALPGVELRTVSDEGGACEVGKVGEIECRGPNVAREYFHQPDLSAGTFRRDLDGWQVTQDLGALDAQGYLRVGGRKRDIIIRGGLNVSPREVEELLTRHPGVKEAAVVGYSDPRYGERICAFIVPKHGSAPTVEEMSAALTEIGVARYKHPERIEVIDALPVSSTGKIRHEGLREILRPETGP